MHQIDTEQLDLNTGNWSNTIYISGRHSTTLQQKLFQYQLCIRKTVQQNRELVHTNCASDRYSTTLKETGPIPTVHYTDYSTTL